MLHRRLLLTAAILATGGACSDKPDNPTDAPLRIAVASNFSPAFDDLANAFQDETGQTATAVLGSTGKLAAQVRHGAPVHVFLSADTETPAALEHDGLAVPGTRFVYAVGQLVLWSADPQRVDPGDGAATLSAAEFDHLAIANPDLAPYGRAAVETLESLELLENLSPKLVRGENINQTHAFVATGAAGLGLVARSQIPAPDAPPKGSAWPVPAGLHTPIEQAAVLLVDRPDARAFLEFLRSDTALEIVRRHGYAAP